MKANILALLLLTSCYSPAEVEAELHRCSEEIGQRIDHTAVIIQVPLVMDGDCLGGKYQGGNPGTIWLSTLRCDTLEPQSIAESSLCHELKHEHLWKLTGDADPGHTAEIW